MSWESLVNPETAAMALLSLVVLIGALLWAAEVAE